ncbi:MULTISPECIES: PDR/VanB family oxidoreductase [Comamonas]|uniref:PDR/VanB family oxidoreductase n=1 Tax=Comamonas TaxID=283 RepID=UPI0006B91785|nr:MULTISPECIES: PDR/VanB family oxidoreductase [Comamonas]
MTAATLRVRVARKTQETPDICSLELVHADGELLPSFSAGSHIDVHLPNGLIRQYSLFNDPAEQHHYMIAILRDPSSRGGSQAVHDLVQEGQAITIGMPRNLFPLAPVAGHSLLLAGGIGITPIVCMAHHLSSQQADFTLHYCTRSRERTAFRDSIAQSAFAPQTRFHHDDEHPAGLPALIGDPSPDRHLYVCGPRGFMDAVLETARRQGWAEQNLHYEFFSASTVVHDTDAAFDIKLAHTGRVIPVLKDQSVTQALAAAGVALSTSCEQGVCGTCLTRVLEGEPDHRDMFLSPDEQKRNDSFLPCCSRSRTPMLVLDM